MLLAALALTGAQARTVDPADTLSKEQIKLRKQSRGVTAMGKNAVAVVEKGSWMFGGTAKGSYLGATNYSIAVINNINLTGYGFSFKPTVMYAVAKNIGVGVRGIASRNTFDMPTAKLEISESVGADLKDLYIIKDSYGASAFARIYLPIGNSPRYAIIGDFILSGEGGRGKFSRRDFSNSKVVLGTYEENWKFGANIDFGLMAFFTTHFAMEAELGILGFGVTGSKSVDNQVYQSSYKLLNPYFDVNFLSLSVGAFIYF